MNPARFAVGQPRLVLLATLLCMVYGALSYAGLPRQENPKLEDRFVSITTYLPGAEPEKVERLVSKVLEEHIAQVDDLEEIFSSSVDGRSSMIVQVERGAPAARRIQEVRDKVQEARAALPADASEPEVDDETLNTYTLILVLAGRDVAAPVLRSEAKRLERELERLPGVRRVDLVGAPEEEVEVAVDLHALSQRGLPLASVVAALAERNALVTAGDLELGVVRSNIQTSGAYGSVLEVGATYLGLGASQLPIRLADVASLRRRIAEPDVLVRASGVPGVGLAVEMLAGRNAVAFGEELRAFAAERETRLPAGLRLEIAADEPAVVADRLERLGQSLALGLVIVVVLTLLGMGWRSGLVVSLTIPLSLLVSMGLLGLVGIALHQMSIAALVIAIGLVVDEAIVVTDNIQRHVDLGRAPREAAVRGLGEIHLAVLAGAATTIAAFIPLMLMEGDIGDFLRSIPMTVSLMLLASVAAAHFVTPLLCAFAHGWSRTRAASGEPRYRRLELRYRSLLGAVMRRRGWVFAGFAVSFVASLGALGHWLLPPHFFPTADRHQFLIEVRLPDGAPLEETDAVMARVEARLAQEREVRDWTAFVGRDAPKFYYNEFSSGRAENRGMLVVNTRESLPFRRTAEVVGRLDRDLKASIAGARVRARELAQGYSATPDIRVYLLGPNLETLRHLSRRVREIAQGVPGVAQVRESFGYDPLTLRAELDEAKASLLGISHRDVALALRTATEGAVATRLREDDEEIPIRVRLAEGQRGSVDALRSLPLEAPAVGRSVPLSQVAALEPAWTTRAVLRYNRVREASLDADVAGRPVLSVTDDVERAVRTQLALPGGYSIEFHGQRAEVNESFLSMAKAAAVAIFLIYIILVVRFQSLVQPLLIVLAIPMALIGSIWGLVLTGNPLGLNAFLGMIALTGIAVNDSIVLLDYVNTLRGRGLELEDAVMSGATSRLRAVTLTSLTTIGGLLPLGLQGGAFWEPFAFAMIFGLSASTALTLLVQPAAYLALERRKRARRERAAPEALAAPPAPGLVAGGS